MRPPLSFIFPTLLAFAVWLGGCRQSPPPPTSPTNDQVKLVTESERSRHFQAVTEKLELGGTLYGYADIDGDIERLAVGLRDLAARSLAEQPMAAAFLPQDLVPIFTDLGLTDVKALGLSSVADSDTSFRNRLFLYTPTGRRGFFAGLGGEARPFITPGLATADADLVLETELDLAVVYQALRSVIVRVAGLPAVNLGEAALKKPHPATGLAPLDLLQNAKGRVGVVLRIDESRQLAPSPDLDIPALDLLLRVEGMGPWIDTLATNLGLPREVRPDGAVSFTLPALPAYLQWSPELIVAGDVATLVNAPSVRPSAGTPSLADDADFQAALARVGSTGNGLVYVSPRFGEITRRKLAEAATRAPIPPGIDLQRLLTLLPPAGMALVSTRENLADGVLFRSHWHGSHKSSLVLANPGVLAGTGLIAAMAIPAFQKVRASSQEKAVLNNLRMLAAARDQYFLETGKTHCTYTDLVGPDRYIRRLSPVAGEDYTKLLFAEDKPLAVTLSDGREIKYE